MFVITCRFHSYAPKRFRIGRQDPQKFFARYDGTLPAQINASKRTDGLGMEYTVVAHFLCAGALDARTTLLRWFVDLLGADVQHSGSDMHTRKILAEHVMGPDWLGSRTVGIANEACGYTLIEFPDHVAGARLLRQDEPGSDGASRL